MDFFGSQERARRQSMKLIPLLILAVIGTVGTLTLIFAPLVVAARTFGAPTRYWDPELWGLVALFWLLFILAGTIWKLERLREGGAAVARALGGRLVVPLEADRDERRLLNVVEEMAVASGLPAPAVYVLDTEKSINAFTAGRTPADAVIGVTRGTLEMLTRDELQGLVAHEFNHILSGDMPLNHNLISMLHGVQVIGLSGKASLAVVWLSIELQIPIILWTLLLVPVAVVMVVVGSVGLFFGRVAKAAVNRQREFLADAAAVQFTRNPPGIAGALMKIGGLSRGSRIRAPRAEEASHLYFSAGIRGLLVSAHPPLAERVRRIDPSFTGEFTRLSVPEIRSIVQGEEETGSIVRAAPTAARDEVEAATEPEAVARRVGTMDTDHIRYTDDLLSRLPGPLHRAVEEPAGAVALVLGLLLDRDMEVRRRQMAVLRGRADPGVAVEVERLLPEMYEMPVEMRLPLLELAVPELRGLSENQYRQLVGTARRLITADDRVDLFEYAVQRVLLRDLEAIFGKGGPPRVRHRSLWPVREPCSVLLSALAYHAWKEGAILPFQEAARTFGKDGRHLEPVPPDKCRLQEVDLALRELVHLSPEMKRQLVRACAACVRQDRKVKMEEAELLRAVCAALDCPMPPFIPGMEI
jgi:Zn-dependent protease with chaperone function